MLWFLFFSGLYGSWVLGFGSGLTLRDFWFLDFWCPLWDDDLELCGCCQWMFGGDLRLIMVMAEGAVWLVVRFLCLWDAFSCLVLCKAVSRLGWCFRVMGSSELFLI